MSPTLLILFSIALRFREINTVQHSSSGSKQIFCNYWSISSSLDKPEIRRAESLCTHIIYTNFGVTDDGYIRSLYPDIDLDVNNGKGYIKKFNEKKKYNKNLKTLAAVGGWEGTETSKRYSHIFSTKNIRNTFVKNSLDFVINNNFNGLAFHWIYPGSKGGNPFTDKFIFTHLLKGLNEEFSKRNLILVVICHGYVNEIDLSYNIKEVTQNVDYVLLESYDFYGDWSKHIGIASGLYGHPAEQDKLLNMNAVITAWINGGAPPEKLIMGIPFFGRTFTLKYKNQTEPGSQFIDAGYKTKLNARGFMSYPEICERLMKSSWTIRWEDTQKNPYAFKDNQWVGFENTESLKFKAKYVIDKNLGGVSVTSLDLDDNNGICGVKNVLLKELSTLLLDDTSNVEYKYYLDTRVLKKRLDTGSIECVYRSTKNLDFFDTRLLKLN